MGPKTLEICNLSLPTIPLDTLKYTADIQCPCPPASMSTDGSMYGGVQLHLSVDTIDTVEGVCNGFLPYTWFLGFPEFSGYHQWQQESQ